MYPNFVIRTNELVISVCCLNFAIVYVSCFVLLKRMRF